MFESLVLKLPNKQYHITLSNYQVVISSDVPALVNKKSRDVFQWARLNKARIYNAKYMPEEIL